MAHDDEKHDQAHHLEQVRHATNRRFWEQRTDKILHLQHSHEKHADLHHGGRDGGLDVAQVLEQDASAPAHVPEEKDDKETRRVIRKIDFRLLPVLAIIYAFALIDRVVSPSVGSRVRSLANMIRIFQM